MISPLFTSIIRMRDACRGYSISTTFVYSHNAVVIFEGVSILEDVQNRWRRKWHEVEHDKCEVMIITRLQRDHER